MYSTTIRYRCVREGGREFLTVEGNIVAEEKCFFFFRPLRERGWQKGVWEGERGRDEGREGERESEGRREGERGTEGERQRHIEREG